MMTDIKTKTNICQHKPNMYRREYENRGIRISQSVY